MIKNKSIDQYFLYSGIGVKPLNVFMYWSYAKCAGTANSTVDSYATLTKVFWIITILVYCDWKVNMAASKLHQELQDEIACSICMEQYNDTDKLPKMLQCIGITH